MQLPLRQTSVFLISSSFKGASQEDNKARILAVKTAAESLFASGCSVVMSEDSPDIGLVTESAESYAGLDGAVFSVKSGAKLSRSQEDQLKFHSQYGNLSRLGRLNITEIMAKTNIQAVILIGGSQKELDLEDSLHKANPSMARIAFQSTGGSAATLAKTQGTYIADRQYAGTLMALAGFRVIEAVKRAKELIDLNFRRKNLSSLEATRVKLAEELASSDAAVPGRPSQKIAL